MAAAIRNLKSWGCVCLSADVQTQQEDEDYVNEIPRHTHFAGATTFRMFIQNDFLSEILNCKKSIPFLV